MLLKTLADGFAAREAARDRGERNTQIVIGVDSSIYRELPEFEDDNGAIVPARRFLEVAGTPQVDLGREFRLPTSCQSKEWETEVLMSRRSREG